MVFVNPYSGTVGHQCCPPQSNFHLPALFRDKAQLYSQKGLNLYLRSQDVLSKFCVSSHFFSRTHHNSFPVTSRQGHAHDVCQKLPLEFDAVITVSGDGLIHEVLNGFAKHADPLKALATPVAPIPTGSGNGLSLNLLGIEVNGHKLNLLYFSKKLNLGGL